MDRVSIWDNVGLLDRFEDERNRKRKSGRLTFDCLNLKLRGHRCICAKNKRLGQANDGSLDLVTVLRGVTSGTCKNCEDFVTEEVTDGTV